MTIQQLIAIANKAYPDDCIAQCFDEGNGKPVTLGGSGDTLALFIVRELCDTFDATASTEDQLASAANYISSAIDELSAVYGALVRHIEEKQD